MSPGLIGLVVSVIEHPYYLPAAKAIPRVVFQLAMIFDFIKQVSIELVTAFQTHNVGTIFTPTKIDFNARLHVLF